MNNEKTFVMAEELAQVHDEICFCPVCENGVGVSLGALGHVEYYRCRDCGATFQHIAEDWS
jgi:tRNA(Ile2) C34 agmatinyltransferase TiaS